MDKTLLQRCEREALHLSGAIQPHGTLLVIDPAGQVSHVAANVATFLGGAPQDWLGRPLPETLRPLADGLGPEPGNRALRAGCLEGKDGLLDARVSRSNAGQWLLELLPQMPWRELPDAAALPLPDPPADAAALAAARQRLVEEIAQMTGFQRVMFYLFREEGDGEVVAEARQGDAYGSYLGLRFPASDIPQIARALYLKNPWRMIPDATVEPVAVIGQTPEPPDLTWSDLRSVSPVHRVYLANMGVVASLSWPVVVGGTLIALVAAHHSAPRMLPIALLETLATRVRAHAFAFASYQSQRRMRLIDGLRYRFAPMAELLRRHGSLSSAWPELAEWLRREFAADGAMLIDGEISLSAGHGFEPAALAAFDGWFCAGHNEFVWCGESLSRQVPGYPLSEIAGALAVRIGQCHTDRCGLRLYLTRLEYVHEVAWGGNPEKPVEYHDGELGIAPRRSFEKWLEKRLGYSRPWDNEARLLALSLRELLRREVCSDLD